MYRYGKPRREVLYICTLLYDCIGNRRPANLVPIVGVPNCGLPQNNFENNLGDLGDLGGLTPILTAIMAKHAAYRCHS